MTSRRIFLLAGLLLIPSVANSWMGDRAVPPGGRCPGGAGAPAPGFAGKRAVPRFQPGDLPIAPPHPSGASVIELLEDDAGRMGRVLAAGDDQSKLGKSGAW